MCFNILILTSINKYRFGSEHILENSFANVLKSGLAIGFSSQHRSRIMYTSKVAIRGFAKRVPLTIQLNIVSGSFSGNSAYGFEQNVNISL